MCRSIHCMMAMSDQRIGMDELMALLQQRLGGSKQDEAQSHEAWLADTVASVEAQARGLEVALAMLKKAPPEEGARLVGLEVGIPHAPEKHGVSSVATYELEGGSFLVVGTDHLTQESFQHTSPNLHGVDGLVTATREELAKKAVAAEADEGQPS